MKSLSTLGITVVGLALLGWVAACAGTDARMDKEMASDMHGQLDSGMDYKMGSNKNHEMNSGMNPKMDTGMNSKMGAMLMGSGGHHASGMVAFGKGMHHRQALILSDLKVDMVPDGYVYLTKNGERMHGVELGKLKQFSGTVSFELPAGINPEDFDSVIIWCKQFNVEIGRAWLANAHHSGW
jgi:hypothetical protein